MPFSASAERMPPNKVMQQLDDAAGKNVPADQRPAWNAARQFIQQAITKQNFGGKKDGGDIDMVSVSVQGHHNNGQGDRAGELLIHIQIHPLPGEDGG